MVSGGMRWNEVGGEEGMGVPRIERVLKRAEWRAGNQPRTPKK